MLKDSKLNILLLGGNGFLGKHLVKLLNNIGYNLVIVDRNLPKEQVAGANYCLGDFNDSGFLASVFKQNDINVVFHLISTLVPGTPMDKVVPEAQKNIQGTMNLIEIMKQNKVNKIIYQSSGGVVYGQNGKKVNIEIDLLNPINYYGWSKLVIEKYIELCHQLFAMDYLIIRPSNIYGPGQNINGLQGLIPTVLNKIHNDQIIEVWGDGSTVRDYLYIDDYCRAMKMLLQKNNWNQIYNVGNGQGETVNNIINYIKEVIDRDFNINNTPGRLVDIPVSILDINKIFIESGWQPTTDIKQGIKLTWEDLQNQYE